MWDVPTGKELQKLEGHTDCVRSVTVTRDGSMIISGSDDKTVRVWDAAAGKGSKLEGQAPSANSVTGPARGSKMVAVYDDNRIRICAATWHPGAVLGSGPVDHPKHSAALCIGGNTILERTGVITSVMFPFLRAPPHLLYFRQHKHTIAGREICAEEWWKRSTKHFSDQNRPGHLFLDCCHS